MTNARVMPNVRAAGKRTLAYLLSKLRAVEIGGKASFTRQIAFQLDGDVSFCNSSGDLRRIVAFLQAALRLLLPVSFLRDHRGAVAAGVELPPRRGSF
jgi:hypothetical protein